LEQQDLNKRLLLALVLSFLVFVGYGYLFPTQPPVVDNNATATAAPQTIRQNVNAANTAQHTQTNRAPVTETSQTHLLNITSETFKMSFDELGRIEQFELLEEKYRDAEGHNLKILAPNVAKPLEIRFSDTALNTEAFNTPYEASVKGDITLKDKPVVLTLTQRLSKATVTKKVTVHPNGAYDIDVKVEGGQPYFITPGHRPVADNSRYMLVRGALVKQADGVIVTIEDGEATGTEVFKNARIASAFDRYVASVFYNFKEGMNVTVLKEPNGDPLLFVEGKPELKLGGYIGPKEYKTLAAINPELTDVIEFGWFTFLAKPFFKIIIWINDVVGNWGWAIIIFTLLIKLVLFPLSYKGMMSMNKLRDLAPKMKELRERYKDDPAKLNMKMMELYKKHGANPMGGCLPMLLQIPVFFALYRMLLNADELQGAAWIPGWIDNLAAPDPYYILPVLMGVTMWIQQRITPSNFTDPMQEKIFKMFPVLMALMFIIMPFPSGLILYWVVNNIFTIGQQYYINRAYERYKEAQKKAKGGA